MSDAIVQAQAVADRVRSELLATLAELDRRRHRLFDWKTQLRRSANWIAAGAGVLVLGIAAKRAISARADERRRRKLPRERRRALRRAWRHPDAVVPPDPPLPVRIAEAIAMGVAVRLATLLVVRGAKRLGI